MAEWRKLSQEETDKLGKAAVFVATKAENAEVEGQGICRCSYCGSLLTVYGIPMYVKCDICLNTFELTWH